MAAVFFSAVLSFAATSIDNIFVLMILYAQAKTLRETMQIAAGQYLGTGVLIALSLLGALGTQVLPPRCIGLLGFLPLFLGIRSWVVYRRGREGHAPAADTQLHFLSVSLLAIANGADNIGVYVPIFSNCSFRDLMVTLTVYAGMTGLGCCLGLALTAHPYVKEKTARCQHILVPLVLIALGLSILAKNYI